LQEVLGPGVFSGDIVELKKSSFPDTAKKWIEHAKLAVGVNPKPCNEDGWGKI